MLQRFSRECSLAGNTSGPSSACSKACYDCTNIFNRIVKVAGHINYYDIRKQCVGSLCYNFSNVENFLNQKSVREELGVGDIQFVSCSYFVYDRMIVDWMKNYEVVLPALLENGVKLLIYAREYDLICNWLGNSRWVDAMVWSYRLLLFHLRLKKSHGLITFLKVHNAATLFLWINQKRHWK